MRGLSARGMSVTDSVLPSGTTNTLPNQSRHHGSRTHYHGNPRVGPRIRDHRNGYDSDTGYRSDFGYYGDVGYLSDTGYRSDVGYRGSHGVHRRRRPDVTYFGQVNRQSHDDTTVSEYEMFRNKTSHRTTSSHSGHHGDGRTALSSYSNVPLSKRMTIGNDEMYEQYPNPNQTAPVRPLPSSGSVGSRTDTSHHRDSLQRPNRGHHNSGAIDTRSLTHSISESVKEEVANDFGADDTRWKAQLYNASVKLQKSPSIEKTDCKSVVSVRSG